MPDTQTLTWADAQPGDVFTYGAYGPVTIRSNEPHLDVFHEPTGRTITTTCGHRLVVTASQPFRKLTRYVVKYVTEELWEAPILADSPEAARAIFNGQRDASLDRRVGTGEQWIASVEPEQADS